MEQRIKDVMATVFEVPVDQITEDASPHSIEEWDSLKHMSLVLALEDEFKIRFQEEEIPSLVSFNIIVATVTAHVE